MKRIFAVLLALSALAACRPSNKYTGEPLLTLQYTVDGEPHFWEDWGSVEKGGFGTNHFLPESEGDGLRQNVWADTSRLATFNLYCNKLRIGITNSQPYFVADSIYTVSSNNDSCLFILSNLDAVSTGGWYSFSRKVSEPYGCYSLYFSFDCADGNGNTYAVRDGVLEIGRRFYSCSYPYQDWDDLIVNRNSP